MKRIIFVLLTIWLALLPWHAFLKTWFSHLFLGSNADFLPLSSNILSLWKEIVLFVVLILFLLLYKRPLIKNIPVTTTWLLITYCSSILVFGSINAPSLSAFLLGLRTDLLFIPALLVGILSASILDSTSIKKLINITAVSLTSAFSIFLVAWIFVPNIGSYFGYSPYESSYVESKPLSVYHCLFLEDQCIPRLQASFSGPNQAASLAILLGGLLLFITQNYLFLVLPLIALLLTFSRSALLGSIVSIFTQIPRKLLVIMLTATAGIVLITLLLAPDIITHGLSSSEHWHKTTEGINRILTNPFGTGLGSAGPVSRRLFGEEKALISENWYLQIGEEAGVIALVFLILSLYTIIKQLWQRKESFSQIMGIVLLATSFQALFLHLWEDSVVTILIWFWVGIGLCYNSKKAT